MLLDSEIFKPFFKVCEIHNFFSDHHIYSIALTSSLSSCSGEAMLAPNWQGKRPAKQLR